MDRLYHWIVRIGDSGDLMNFLVMATTVDNARTAALGEAALWPDIDLRPSLLKALSEAPTFIADRGYPIVIWKAEVISDL